jgi:uncharacterized membrane protein
MMHDDGLAAFMLDKLARELAEARHAEQLAQASLQVAELRAAEASRRAAGASQAFQAACRGLVDRHAPKPPPEQP